MYVEEIKNKQGRKLYRTVLIRESYKEKGKVKHRTIANISRLPASTERPQPFLSSENVLAWINFFIPAGNSGATISWP